jgi:hypothetical protein
MSFKYKSCAKAAKAGDLDELKNMRENGRKWDWETPASAAENGHLECLKYAHQNGCNWHYSTTLRAALNGHLECLKYAHENGCEWDGYTTMFAATYGQLDCFKYCFQEWDDPQEFWNLDFALTKIIYKIDLDDKVWRRLFDLDLSKYSDLQVKVNDKKKEIEEMKEESKKILETRLPLDIIKYCIQIYF